MLDAYWIWIWRPTWIIFKSYATLTVKVYTTIWKHTVSSKKTHLEQKCSLLECKAYKLSFRGILSFLRLVQKYITSLWYDACFGQSKVRNIMTMELPKHVNSITRPNSEWLQCRVGIPFGILFMVAQSFVWTNGAKF